MPHDLPHQQRLKDHLTSRRETLISTWRERVLTDRQVASANQLSRNEFRDHVPVILQILEERLVEPEEIEHGSEESATAHEREAALTHGDQRWHYGYSMEEVMREWGHLNMVVLDEIEQFCSQHLKPENRSVGSKARHIWAEIMGEGITQSAARFDALQKSDAAISVKALEAIVENSRLFEQERGVILRQATHDIRGSLSVVRGATSLLDWQQIETLSPEDRQNVFRILTSGVHSLWEMMSEMLDLARLEAGGEMLQIAHFDVSVALRELGESAQGLAREKNLHFTIDGPPTLWLQGDAIKMKRIAQNLLLNALKYTKSGYVKLCWDELPENRWSLEIHDSGPGIDTVDPALIEENLYELTKQALSDEPSNADSKHYGQSEGVGLSIVKRLCELCNATFHIETGQGGSCFRVVFPALYDL